MTILPTNPIIAAELARTLGRPDIGDKIIAEIQSAINREKDRRNQLGLPGFPFNTMELIREAVGRAIDGVA